MCLGLRGGFLSFDDPRQFDSIGKAIRHLGFLAFLIAMAVLNPDQEAFKESIESWHQSGFMEAFRGGISAQSKEGYITNYGCMKYYLIKGGAPQSEVDEVWPRLDKVAKVTLLDEMVDGLRGVISFKVRKNFVFFSLAFHNTSPEFWGNYEENQPGALFTVGVLGQVVGPFSLRQPSHTTHPNKPKHPATDPPTPALSRPFQAGVERSAAIACYLSQYVQLFHEQPMVACRM